MARPISDEISHIDPMIERWAKWVRDGHTGWPARTLLARVIEQGFTGAAQQGQLPEMDEATQTIERAVLRLKDIERQVVMKHYLHWQPVEVSARYCNMSANRFRTILHRSRRRIADFVDGHCYYNNNGAIRAA